MILIAAPSQPGTPECVTRNRERIELKWAPPKSDGGNPIKGYIIERRDKSAKKREWNPIHRGDFHKVSYDYFLFINLNARK